MSKKYTVTLKVQHEDGFVSWDARIVVDAEDPASAEKLASEIVMKSQDMLDCSVVEFRTSEYLEGEEKRFSYDAERWRLEEETKTAPARIARALDRIADKMGYHGERDIRIVQEDKSRKVCVKYPIAFAILLLLSAAILLAAAILRLL